MKLFQKAASNPVCLILIPFIIYPFIYFYIFHSYGNGYKLINNADRIINTHWLISAAYLVIINIYLSVSGVKMPVKMLNYAALSLLALLMFKPFTMFVSMVDFALFGW